MKWIQRSYKALFTFILISSFAASLAAQSDAVSVHQFSELAGCWVKQSENGWGMESWMIPADDLMMGVSHSVRNNATLEYEFLQIRKKESVIYYVAFPSGQQETWFRLTYSENRKWVFENPEHDFPQRIIYQLADHDNLKAVIVGNIDGKIKSIDFPFHRTSCGSEAFQKNSLLR